MINIALSRTSSRASPIRGVVSILPRVDLLKNTEVDWFCILSLFRLDTLSAIYIHVLGDHGSSSTCVFIMVDPLCYQRRINEVYEQ